MSITSQVEQENKTVKIGDYTLTGKIGQGGYAKPLIVLLLRSSRLLPYPLFLWVSLHLSTALLVIPELKLSDKGLFDGRAFQFIDVCRKPVRAIPGPVESP